jgi:hypothetical protein
MREKYELECYFPLSLLPPCSTTIFHQWNSHVRALAVQVTCFLPTQVSYAVHACSIAFQGNLYEEENTLCSGKITPWSRVLFEKHHFSASQEITFILLNPRVYYSTHKSLILSQINPVHIPPPTS